MNTEPTKQNLESPEFNAVWNAIKKWDIDRGDYEISENGRNMYAGATGTDVMIILNALRKTTQAQGQSSGQKMYSFDDIVSVINSIESKYRTVIKSGEKKWCTDFVAQWGGKDDSYYHDSSYVIEVVLRALKLPYPKSTPQPQKGNVCDELISAYDDYIKLLDAYISKHAGYLYAHRIKASKEEIQSGKDARERIEKAKSNLKF